MLASCTSMDMLNDIGICQILCQAVSQIKGETATVRFEIKSSCLTYCIVMVAQSFISNSCASEITEA